MCMVDKVKVANHVWDYWVNSNKYFLLKSKKDANTYTINLLKGGDLNKHLKIFFSIFKIMSTFFFRK